MRTKPDVLLYLRPSPLFAHIYVLSVLTSEGTVRDMALGENDLVVLIKQATDCLPLPS